VETMTFSTSIRAGGGSVIGETGSYEGDELILVANQVAASDTLLESVALDVSPTNTLKAMFIFTDQEIIVTPKHGGSPTADGPFTIPAKKALYWNSARTEANPFTDDFDTLHIDNTANDTKAANFKAGFLQST
jgi:hypothetical protein